MIVDKEYYTLLNIHLLFNVFGITVLLEINLFNFFENAGMSYMVHFNTFGAKICQLTRLLSQTFQSHTEIHHTVNYFSLL